MPFAESGYRIYPEMILHFKHQHSGNTLFQYPHFKSNNKKMKSKIIILLVQMIIFAVLQLFAQDYCAD